jgi:hypothetical protein
MSASLPEATAPAETRDGPLVVGLMYPEDYEVRPRQELDDDLAALRAIDPAIEIIEVRYGDPRCGPATPGTASHPRAARGLQPG